MSPIDILLLMVGAGLVLFLTYQRMARALFALGVLWAVSLLSGLLYKEAAYRVQAVAGSNVTLTEGIMFALLLVIFFVVGYILVAVAFPETRLPKIGFLDVLMGLLLGIIVAAIFVSLLHNAFGVMVSERWTDSRSWTTWRGYFVRSPLRPIGRTILMLWQQLLAPFFPGLPPALTPQ